MGGDWKDFFRAIQLNDLELVKYHVRMGVDPNYQHPEYMTAPLMECIRFERLEIAAFLLENGTDATAKEHGGATTAMSIAVMNGNKEAIRLLEKYV
ncbi:MAG: ankyrin repeat protein [Saprospiraceae bacterium]|jgi:ankyrin repeat protein